MIVTWIAEDGSVAHYDSIRQLITHKDDFGVVVSPVRAAGDDEIAIFNSMYPAVTEAQLAAKNSVVTQLYGVLSALRGATADGSISEQEFSALNPQVQSALLAFSQYEGTDPDVQKLAFLVLVQVSYAYSFLLSAGKQASLNLSSLIFDLRGRVATLESDLALALGRIQSLENNA